MHATEALAALRDAGLVLRRVDGKLRVEPRDRITPDARKLIVTHLDTLLGLVAEASAPGRPTTQPPTARPPADSADRAVSWAPVTTSAKPNPFGLPPQVHAAHQSDGGGPVTPITDPGPLIEAYHERLAIIAEAGDVPEADAHRIAAEEAGADLDTLARSQIAAWLRRIEGMAEPRDDRKLARLRQGLVALLGEVWLHNAARLGWGDVAVFGLCPAAPMVRIECWGLAVGLVWSPHAHRGRLPKVERIDGAMALLRLPSGQTCVAGRFARGLDHAVPCWELPAFAVATNIERRAA